MKFKFQGGEIFLEKWKSSKKVNSLIHLSENGGHYVKTLA
jgi:hypothetical protein